MDRAPGRRSVRSAGSLLALALVVVAPRAVPAVGPEPGSRWTIETATARAGFDLGAFAHTVHGTTGGVAGEVRSLERLPEGTLRLAGRIVIDPATLETGNRKRDRKMYRESLAVEQHPTIEFRPASLGAAGPECPAAAASCHALRGDLTIRGVTRPVEIAVELRSAGAHWLVDGSVELGWGEFGVPDPSFLFVRVKRTVQVTFHVELVPAESATAVAP